MRIVHIITRLILGGAQQNTVLSCAAQVAAGHEVWLVYGPIYGPEGSLLEEAKRSGATLVEVKSMRRAILPVHDYLCYRALRRLIRAIAPDVVHTHSSKAGIVGRAAAWAEKHEDKPVVIHTVHGLPFHERQPGIINAIYVALERWAARRCDRILGVTRAMIDSFRERHIGRPEQYDVVPSGVDVTAFSPPVGAREAARRELGIAPDAPVVGIVARLDKLKGQDDLLDVMPRLIERLPGLRLVIVGDGWHRAALEDRVEKENLAGNVIFTGLVPPARVGEMMSSMDVAALPSYQEGQPRTLVQALLCGCAVVGYDAGGIGEVCIDGQTGRLVPVGDRDALARAILGLLSDPAERLRLAEEGGRFARERFDVRLMTRRLEEIYAGALAAAVRD
ncbi:MAG: glycosyltransferase family 4 protein [Planctomycetes bacterium]|nr:glycosyltransferase family 4 protein [Planctomycetota bacterium]